MLARWVPLLRNRGRRGNKPFQRSLVRNVLIILLLTSLIPIILIGTLNTFRSRSMRYQQVNEQTDRILANEVGLISEYVDMRNMIIDRLVTDENFTNALVTLLNTPTDEEGYQQARSLITYSFRGNPRTAAEGFFDQFFLLLPDAEIALASDEQWIANRFGGDVVSDPFILDLIGTNKSIFTFDQQPDNTHQLVLYTSRSFTDPESGLIATLIATARTTSDDHMYHTLVDAGGFLPAGAQSFFFTARGSLVSIEPEGMRFVDPAGYLRNDLLQAIEKQPAKTRFSSVVNNEAVVTAAQWLPEHNIGLAMVVPDRSIMGQAELVDPFNLVLLAVSILVSSGVIIAASTRVVRPLVKLAESADSFSKGDFSTRVEIDRSDEIGMLANSFNHMADELSELYHSLETAVESRTATLRAASEVAQEATSTATLKDTLGRTVELIAERFGFYHVAIYLFDETGQDLVLQEASGISGELIKQRGDRIEVGANTLIRWVADNKQAGIINNVREDPLFCANDLLPDTACEVAIPIILGTEVLGVLDIQSTLEDAFTNETVAVFQTFANQISSTLQATRLLESTQASYDETSLLFRGTRQVAQARSDADIVNALGETLVQLPYLGAVLSLEGENFKILVLTDSKTGKIERSLQSLNIPVGRMARLLEEKGVVLLDDITQSSEFDTMVSFLLRRDCISAALVPVLENGRVNKVLVLGAKEANQLTYEGLKPYQNLAEVIGAVIEKMRVLHTLQTRLAELQILASFSQAISAETDLTNLYRVLHQQIADTFGSDLEFAVAIYNEQDNLIEFPYFLVNNQVITIEPRKLGEGLTSKVITSRQPLLLTTEEGIRKESPVLVGRVARSWLGIPLIFAGHVVGAILIQDLNNENRFTQDDLNLLMTLAPQIATSVRNTQLYTETQAALRAYDQERFLLRTLLDSIPEGVSFKDTHGRYIRASESIAQAFNLSAQEMVGKTDYDLMEHEAAEKIFREEQMVMNIGSPEIGRITRALHPSGKELWIQTTRIPVRSEHGDPYGLLVIQSDITELKEAEALAQRRADQVMTAAEIARDVTGTLDINSLLQKSIDLIRERFGYYHASVFLLDPAEEYAVLRASTGDAGRQMLAAGHRLAVGSKSIVGQATATGNSLIVNNVANDLSHLPNPLLPDTRSEMAIPLKVGDRIYGALDVQSTEIDAFSSEDVSVLGILADQMAVALVNGELFAKTQELLGKHRLLRQITIAASTSTELDEALLNVVKGLHTAKVADLISILMLNDEGQLQVESSAGYEGTAHLEARLNLGQGIIGAAALEKRPVLVKDVLNDSRYYSISSETRSELAIPILFSDELLGVLNLESKEVAAFDENDQEILGALGNNLGGVIANIRLVQQVRQQVVRERQLFDVTSRVRRSVDLNTILQTSAREIARALGARRASIRITAGAAPVLQERHLEPGAEEDAGSRNGSNNSNGSGREELE